jgi:argininosuccinate lyase
MGNKAREKLWGGRFSEGTDALVERFTASEHFDRRLYRHDIEGSSVHAEMLARQGIISEDDALAIKKGLSEIKDEIEEGRFEWRQELEDVHMNIEDALTRRIGEAGKRLHTARSRNDQVATDFRLYVREEIDRLDGLLAMMQEALVKQAEEYFGQMMPGYTHLQRAQPVLWSHHMLAYFEMFRRDRARLADCRSRLNVSPLGSAALAGTGFPVDRKFVADALGFDDITANSIDAVSDRDFVVEFLGAASLVMAHLSRLSEELVLWTSSEFGFVTLPDRFCTGSSIMPQKKNPDVPELVRGKTGRVYGHLMAVLTMIKGTPLAYNRDFQEDKEALFDTVDTVTASVELMAEIVAGMKPVKESLDRAVNYGFLTATDLADYLVSKGVPFRTAHAVSGKAVAECVERGIELSDLTLDEFKRFHDSIEDDIFDVLTPAGSVNVRRCPGGTSPESVRDALDKAKEWLDTFGSTKC